MKLLSRKWYERPTVTVARDLLGKVLAYGGAKVRLTETEAYHGDDPASHCRNGPTDRCRVMFGPGGVAYVYFIYGLYEMLNLVTERNGYPGAVLLRGALPLAGLPAAAKLDGPGKLCRALGVKLSDTGRFLRVYDDGYVPRKVLRTPRIGISAGTEKPWRFLDSGVT